ncbi:MAG: beta-N-acetylhexosaminidase [Thermodesulfobacteriota bacterium]|nr:beta-N-acetylhexosaminidase [Thermodesulfobacteriota bacterium]
MYRADTLSEEKLAGQSLMVGFEGQALDHDLRSMIGELHVGGLILFKRNIHDPEGLGELCAALQSFSVERGHPPLMISVDQEGGSVARLGPPFTVFPGNRAMGRTGSPDTARTFGATTARELKGAGITMNLAPVLDVMEEGGDCPVMGDRVFGDDPELVAALGSVVIETLQRGGIAATAKHFPGMGGAVADPHRDVSRIHTEREVLESRDLVPFRAAIQRGVEAVMLSHVVYDTLDPHWPAGLSSIIAKDLLRETMGFHGVTITDDLDMGAIDTHFDVETVVQRICEADIDIALICRDRAKIEAVYGALLRAIKASSETRTRRALSVQRLLDLKGRYAPHMVVY